MLKLLLVFLFILKINTENENSFDMKIPLKRKSSDLQHTEQIVHTGDKKRLNFNKRVTRRNVRDSIGKRREFEPNEVLEDSNNHLLSSFKKDAEYVPSLPSASLLKHSEKDKHAKASNGNSLNRQNLKRTEDISALNYGNTLAKLISTPIPSTKSKLNVGPADSIKYEPGPSKVVNTNMLNTPNVVNEEPHNSLENLFEEGNDEEQGKKYYDIDSIDISNYKSDTGFDTRKDCLPFPNKGTKRFKTPMVMFDSEQDDGPVSLIFSLINLNTLKPKTRYYFTENKIVKKVNTQDPCKCLTKASTKKSSVDTHTCAEKSAVTKDQPKKRKSKVGFPHENTNPTQGHNCKHVTPLFTVLPWPDLTVTRNLCSSSKLNPKNKLAHPLFSPPSSKSTQTSPYVFETSTKNNAHAETTHYTSPTPYSVSSLSNTQNNNFTSLIQSEMSLDKGSHTLQSENTSFTSKTHDKGDISGGKTGLDPPPVTSDQGRITSSSSPLISLVNLSKESTYTFFSGSKHGSTQEYNVSDPIDRTSYTTISTTQSENQAISTCNDTNLNISTQESRWFSSTMSSNSTIPFTEQIAQVNSTSIESSSIIPFTNRITQANQTNTESITLTESTIHVINTPEMSTGTNETSNTVYGTQNTIDDTIPGINSSNSVSPNYILQETAQSSNSAGENTICMNITSTVSSSSSVIPHLYQEYTAIPASDMNQIQRGVGVENITADVYQVAETTNSLFPLCPEDNTFSMKNESSNAEKSLTRLEQTESLDDSQMISFSPPPAAVFSHEPEFIETLFDNGKSGVTIGLCLDPSGRPISTTDATEVLENQPSHKVLSTPAQAAVTSNIYQQGRGEAKQEGTINELSSETVSSTEPSKSILLGYLKSMSTCDRGTISNGPFKVFFSDSMVNASKCLDDYSRLFNNLATKKCD